MARRLGSLVVLLVVLALVAFAVTPALAHHKDDHQQGPPAQESDDANARGGGGGDDDGIADDDDDNRHPSGKDRETNDGSTDDVQGGTQTSNPDNDGHGPERNSCKGTSEDRVGGCADKPGGTGGVDTEDQDWNNGCGNDDDFEDDNEGLCGGPDKTESTTDVGGGSLELCPDGTVMTAAGCDVKDDVGGTTTKPDVRTDEVADDDDVLGERIFRAPPATVAAAQEVAAAPGAALPFTGGNVVTFVVLGLGMIAGGWSMVRRK